MATYTGTNDVDDVEGGYNIMYGKGAADFLQSGEAGYCYIDGGDGNDYLTLLFSPNQSTNGKILGGLGNDTIIGSNNKDFLLGDNGNDLIIGGSSKGFGQSNHIFYSLAPFSGGNDRMNGGAGSDALYGFGGDDYLYGGSGDDRGNIITPTEDVWHDPGAHAQYSYSSKAGLYGGAGNDHIYGEEGNDDLFGQDGKDILHGGTGNDLLRGGSSADRLYGEDGADFFEFRTTSDSTVSPGGRDTIMDFSQGERDKLDLRAIDANTKIQGNQGFHFIGSHAFSHKAGEVQAKLTSQGNTLVSGDVNGDGHADFSILLDGHITLRAIDFL